MYAHIQSIVFDPDMCFFPVQEVQDLNSMNSKMRLKVKYNNLSGCVGYQ